MEVNKQNAERLAKLEKGRARLWEEHQMNIVDVRSRRIDELAALKSFQNAEANRLNIDAVSRVQKSGAAAKKVALRLKETADEIELKKSQRAAELEASIAKTTLVLAANTSKIAATNLKKLKKLEDEKEAMIASGLNPYAIFRRKEVEDEARREKEKLIKAVEANKIALKKRLAKEGEDMMRRDAELARVKEAEKTHRESLGRHVIEKRNKDYITSITIGAKEVLDPTGREIRVNPSKVTEIPDYGFGLGKSAKIPEETMVKITEKIREKLKVDPNDFGEFQRLVKAYLPVEEKVKERRAKSTGVNNDDDYDSDDMHDISRPSEGRKQETVADSHGGVSALADDSNEAIPKQSSPQQQRKYQTTELSKFERDCFNRAIDRQRTHLEKGAPQVVVGRVFENRPAFISKPAEIAFIDFDLGETYKKNFLLTNVSYTFNSFKLIGIPEEYSDAFTITFEKPGRMSAGMSCVIEIVFSPQVNRDIRTNINILTETGPLGISLVCLAKRCGPRVLNTDIDFGSMVIGQMVEHVVKIVNTEALPATFSISRVTDETASGTGGTNDRLADENEEEVKLYSPEERAPASSFEELQFRVHGSIHALYREKRMNFPVPISFRGAKSIGSIDGYSSMTMNLLCAPLSAGDIQQKFLVVFDGLLHGTQSGASFDREQFITARVRGMESPIFLSEEEIDIKCTVYGRIYRAHMEVKNRSGIAYRVNINIPAPLNRYVEVSPNMAFIQSKGSQTVNIKFTPTERILDDLSHFSFPIQGFLKAALLRIPFKIEIANTVFPVYCVLRSTVCTSALKLSASALDFGSIYVNQQTVLPLSVTNLSMQAQKLAFVNLPSEVSIDPNDGFFYILGGETVVFHVAFCAAYASSTFALQLKLVTSLAEEYFVVVKANAQTCPLSFSSTSLVMRTAAPGDRVVESVFVKNVTKSAQSFEIMYPDPRLSWLKISPTIVNLEAGKSARLELEYTPPRNARALQPRTWYQSAREIVQKDAIPVKSTTTAATPSMLLSDPFEDWADDADWVVGRGVFGEIRWASISRDDHSQGGPLGNVDSDTDNVEKEDEPTTAAADGNEDKAVGDPIVNPRSFTDNDWGISGIFRVPIFIKNKKAVLPVPITAGAGVAGADDLPPPPSKDTLAPMFLSVLATTVPPLIEADVLSVDFGKAAVGTRMIKWVRVKNLTPRHVLLSPSCLSAIGPFSIINAARFIQPNGGMVKIIIEYLPREAGLVVETLDLQPVMTDAASSHCGHSLRVTLRGEGLQPSLSIAGLSAAHVDWSPRDGILDFGHTLARDVMTKKVTVSNDSDFAVDVNITRTSCTGLSPLSASLFIETTAAGLPIFGFRPETLLIQPRLSADIEVIFRPDRGRLLPFREDLLVRVGATKESLRVGLFGRSWKRQIYVIPSNAHDEVFMRNDSDPSDRIEFVEDLGLAVPHPEAKAAALSLYNSAGMKPPAGYAAVLLEYPDPFQPGTDTSSYVESEIALPKKTQKLKRRAQKRKVIVGSVKPVDNRPGAGNGTYEVVFDKEAKESGLWTASPEKGSVAAGVEVTVDITCSIPQPASSEVVREGESTSDLGGEWKIYYGYIAIKGGWIQQDEIDEVKVPLRLKVFASN